MYTVKLSRVGGDYHANVYRDGIKIFRSPSRIRDITDEEKMKDWFRHLIAGYQKKEKDKSGNKIVGGADAFLGVEYTAESLGL